MGMPCLRWHAVSDCAWLRRPGLPCTSAFGGVDAFWGGSSHDELPELAHHKALEKSLGIKDQSCPVLRLSHKAAR